MGLVKNRYEFQYFPSSTCEKYDFSYGERFKLKHNFIYNPYPSRRRYWFFYEIRDPLILEDGETLLKLDESRGMNVDRTLELNMLSRNMIQEREIELIVGSILKNNNHRELNIENTKDLTKVVARKISQQYDYIIHEKRANNIDVNDDISMCHSRENNAAIEKGKILKSDLMQHISDIVIEGIDELSIDRSRDVRASLIEGGEDIHYTKDSVKPTDFDLEGSLDLSRVIGRAIINNGLELKLEPSKREIVVQEQQYLSRVGEYRKLSFEQETQVYNAVENELAARGIDIQDDSHDLDKVDFDLNINSDIVDRLKRDARSFYVEEQEAISRDVLFDMDKADSIERLESYEGSAKDIRLSDETVYRVVSDTLSRLEVPPVELLKVAKGGSKIYHEDDVNNLEKSRRVESEGLLDIQIQDKESVGAQNYGDGRIRFDDNDLGLSSSAASRNIDLDTSLDLDRVTGKNDGLALDEDKGLIRSSTNSNVSFWEDIDSLEVDTDKVGTDIHDSESFLNKASQSVGIQGDKESSYLDTVEREATVEREEMQATLHKRLWFIKQYDSIDYKILPNEDYSYPMGIDKMVHKPSGDYKFSYTSSYDDLEDLYGKEYVYEIELYNSESELMYRYFMPYIESGQYAQGNVSVKYEVSTASETKPHTVKYEINIRSGTEVAYMIIRQPKDINGVPVLYVATEKLLAEKHPLPMGSDLGLKEIPIHIPIMVEFINVLLLFWSKFYFAFTGYTGSRAIFGLVSMVYEWLTLETSQIEAAEAMEDYYRCYRWFRWEAEKTYHRAKQDPTLSGNYWIEEVLFEMIEYMETHHFNIMPEFEEMHLMDEYRDIFQDPSFDMEFTLDKMKGVRNRVIDKNKRLND